MELHDIILLASFIINTMLAIGWLQQRIRIKEYENQITRNLVTLNQASKVLNASIEARNRFKDDHMSAVRETS